MKKTAFLLALCVAVSAIFVSCGTKDVVSNETQADASFADVPNAEAQSGDTTAVPDGETIPAQSGNFADAVTQAANGTAIAGKQGGDAAQTGTTAAAEDPAKPTPDTTPERVDPAQTAQGTTKKADGSAQTASGTTKKEDGSAQTVSGTTNANGTPHTPQTGTPVQTTRPGSEKTTAASSTAAPVTQYVPAKGNRVEAKRTYLKEAAVTYVSALNEQDLARFNITGDKADEILKNKSDWTAYTIQIDFRNNETMPVTIYYLNVTGNGTGDVYVNGDLAGDLGLAPGAKMTERFYVLAKKSDADGKVLNQLQKMKMQVQYAATPEDDMVTPKFVNADVG